jgi:hypothetical protein
MVIKNMMDELADVHTPPEVLEGGAATLCYSWMGDQ